MHQAVLVRLAIVPDPELPQGVLHTEGNYDAKRSWGQVSFSRCTALGEDHRAFPRLSLNGIRTPAGCSIIQATSRLLGTDIIELPAQPVKIS